MVGQRHGLPISGQLRQQRLNELIEVIDLLELAARILVEPALAREDMQGLEQLYALAGLEPQLLGNILRTCLGGLLQALLFFGLGHHFPAFASPWPLTGQRAPTSRSSQPSMPIFSSVSILRS